MSAYYNEFDAYAAEWLKNLIAAGLIADGVVDSRSIVEVCADDLKGFTQCHFFAGIGVWSHALRLAGWGDSRPVWTGSCPCQPFSAAGSGRGFDDERHLWPEFFRLIQQCRPSVVFGEQVASKDGLAWLDLVHADLEKESYATAAVDICAAGLGAPHIRQRLCWVGHANNAGLEGHWRRHQAKIGWVGEVRPVASTSESGYWEDADWLLCRDGKRRPVEPGTFPLAHGAPARVGRLRAYGNAIVPQVAQAFIESFMEARP